MSSASVDERIVELKIDQDKFESGAKKAIGMLENLDKSLNNLGKQNSSGLDSITGSLDKVTNKISIFGTIGDQILRNFGNQISNVINEIGRLSTSLTTQQMLAGWDKYAEKTSAVQTIMAATNKDIGVKWADQAEQLEYVNEQLARLNKFTDETSYKFIDMVNSIGKFTSNGREIEESVTAMEGISTWAALSGGTPAEASRAMYNLSQALGLGAVTTIDWKSIENANMATYEFKKTAIETAEELGVLKKVSEDVWENAAGATVTIANFRESLSTGGGDNVVKWFNSDVLLATLNKYGEFSNKLLELEDQLGYDTATTLLRDLKKYEEATDKMQVLTSVAKHQKVSIDELKEAFDELLDPQYELGRRAFQAAQEAKTFQEAIDSTKDAVSTVWVNIYEMLFGDYLQAKELWTNLSETLYDIFAGPVNRIQEIFDDAFGSNNAAKRWAKSTGVEVTGTIETFEKRLISAGKTFKDFEEAFYSVADETMVDAVKGFDSLEDALTHGAISAEVFRKALASLIEDKGGVVSLNKALALNGKTMSDFEEALHSVADSASLEAIDGFNSIEEALRNGVVSAELFQQVLQSLGIQSDNVSQSIQNGSAKGTKSLQEMREVALKVLRGDYGNGAERRNKLREEGYEYDIIQGIANQLHSYHNLDDKTLTSWMELYWQYNNLSEKYGTKTFKAFLETADAVSETNEEIETTESLLADADKILEEIYGSNVIGKSGGELFRESLTNLMTFFDDIASAFDKVFLKIFGGSEEEQQAIETMGDKFYLAALKFHQFTEAIQLTKTVLNGDGEEIVDDSRWWSLIDVLTLVIKPFQIIVSLIKIVGSVIKSLLPLALSIISSIGKIITPILDAISSALDKVQAYLSRLNIADKLTPIVEKLGAAFEWLGTGLYTIIGAISKLTSGAFSKLFGWVRGLYASMSPIISGFVGKQFGDFSDKIQSFFSKVQTVYNTSGIQGIFASVTNFFQTKLPNFGNVTERLSQYWDTLKSIFSNIYNGFKSGGIQEAFKVIGQTFNKYIPLVAGKVSTFISGIFSNFDAGEILNRLQSALQSISNVIRTFFQGLFSKGDSASASKVEVLTRSNPLLAIEEIQNGSTGDRIHSFSEWLSNLGETLHNAWQKFIDFTSDIFGEKVPRVLNSDSFSNLTKFVFALSAVQMGAGLLTGSRGIKKAGQGVIELGKGVSQIGVGFAQIGVNLKNAMAYVGTVGTGIGNIGEAIKSIAKTGITVQHIKKTDTFGTTLLKLAASIGIIVGALWVLSQIPEDQLWEGLKVIAIIAGGLIAISLAGKFIKFNATPFITMALSLLILSYTLKKLIGISWSNILQSIGKLALLLLEIGLFTKFAGKGFENKMYFISMAIGINLLVVALKSLSKLDADSLIQGLIGLGSVLLELGLFMRLAGKGFSNKVNFVAIAISVGLLVGVVKEISRIDNNALIKGLIGLGTMLLMLALFTRMAGANKISGILALAIALEVMILAVKQIGNIKVGALIKGLVGLGSILLMLNLFLKNTGDIKKISGLIGLAIAIGILVSTVNRIGRMKTGVLLKGLLGLAAIMMVFNLLTKSAKGMSLGAALSSLLLFIGLIAAFIAVFYYIQNQNMDIGSIQKFAISISMLLVSLGVAMSMLSKIPIKGSLIALGNFALFTTGLGLFMVGLGELTEWAYSKGYDISTKLERAAEIMQGIGNTLGSFINGLVNGLNINNDFDIENIGTKLSKFIENAQGFIDGVQKVPKEASQGAANLASAIISIGGAEVVSALASIFTDDSMMESFSKDIVALGEGLAKYASIVSGIDASQVKSVNQSARIAKSLADVAEAVPANGPLSRFFNGIGDLGVFADNLEGLANGLSKFVNGISGIENFDQEKVDSAISATKALAEIEKNMEGLGGWEDKIFGVQSLGIFSSKLPSFSTHINEFITELSKIDYGEATPESIEKLISIVDSLATLETNLEGQGGWEDKIVGMQSLAVFSTAIPKFGKGLNSFITEISSIDFTSIDLSDGGNLYKLIDFMNAVAKLETNLEGQGGLEDLFAGVQSLSIFGGEIPKFAEGLNGFISEARSIIYNDTEDREHIVSLLSVAELLNSFEGSLNKQGGFVDWLVGAQNMGTFGTNATQLGNGLKGFLSGISGLQVNAENVDTALSVVTQVSDWIHSQERTGGLFEGIGNLFAGNKSDTIGELSSMLVSLGTSLSQFSTSMANVSVGNFSDVLTILSIIDEINGFKFTQSNVSINIQEILNTFQSYGQTAGKGLTTGIQEILGDGTVSVTFLQAAEEMIQVLTDGIAAGQSSVTSVIRSVLSASYRSVSSYTNRFYYMGQMLAQGLANGIYSKKDTVVSAAHEVADAASKEVNKTLQNGSPSKLTTQYGKWFTEGLAIGILAVSSDVEYAAKSMSSKAVSAVDQAMGVISSILEDDNYTPVISPVVDLSNVSSAAGLVGSMLRGIPHLTIDLTSSVSGRMQSYQNPSMAAASNASTQNINNLYIDGIKYNTDDYVDTSIRNFVETMTRKQKMYA